MKRNIEIFSLDIFREEIKKQYNHEIENIFQQFCFDLLSSEYPQYSFIPFPTAGQDGSIDHYAFSDNGKKVIVECKKNNTKDNAANALSQLKSKLLENLKKDEAKNNLYKPWFNKEFEQYFYCTSAHFSTAKELEDFEKSIKDMLDELSKINALSHLAKVVVKLFTWNNLKPILERDAFCYYKWIANQTVGISYLDDNTTEKSHYKQNLYGSKLPFISRDIYKQQNLDEDIETENDIFEKLFHDDRYSGILIHGQGGVGKTRLMLELGFRAKQEKWIVLKITKNLKELSDLDLRSDTNYCLLFDYIEENRHFTEDVENTLFELFSHAHIKIIATSRTSFLLFNDIPKGFFGLDISKDVAYIKHVTNEILKTFSPEISSNNIKPSFAVFMKEDFQNNPQIFQNFQDYIKDRLCKTLNKTKFAEIDNNVFATLASLPYKTTQGNHADDMRALERDGWLTEDNGEYSSEHDTIIDELIELYLDQPKFTSKEKRDEISALFANGQNTFSVFRTIDRISEWILKERQIADYAFFANIIKSLDKIDRELINLLSKTALVDEKHRFSIFTEKYDLFEEYINHFMFVYPLAFALNKFAKNSSNGVCENTITILEKWLGINRDNISTSKQSYRILSTALKAFGIHHSISSFVKPWLSKYPLEMETSFVLRTWLDAGGDTESVREFIVPWLSKYSLETSFVLQSWLDAGGDTESVREFIVTWLSKYPLEMETRFVLRAWLDAGGDIESVREVVKPWLMEHPLEMETSFVLRTWLDAGGDIESVREFIVPWLSKFPLEMETSFVLRSWLDAGGDIESVREFVKPWLTENSLEMETSFVLKSWLDVGGDKENVQKFVVQWLEKYPLEMETHFVLRSWLNAGGDKANVQKFVVQWLEKYPLEMETHFVLKSWLNVHGELSKQMIEILFAWVRAHKERNEIDFVLKRIYKIPKKILTIIPNDITKIAFEWCAKNIDSKESLYMLSYMTKNANFHPAFLLVARKIMTKYVSHSLTASESACYETIIYGAFKNRNFTQESDIQLLKQWVNSENSFKNKNIFYIVSDTNYYQRLKELVEGKNKAKLDMFFKQA